MALNLKKTNDKNKADQMIREKVQESVKDNATKETLKSLENTLNTADNKIEEPKKEAPQKDINVQKPIERKTAAKKEPAKMGRPKIYDKPKTKFCAYIDKEIHDEMEEYSSLFKGGKSEYLEKLIKQDLEKNRDKYREMKNMLK